MTHAHDTLVIVPVWGRYELTKIILASWACPYAVLVVGSEGYRSRAVCPKATRVFEREVMYLEHPNQPLGKKFNAGVMRAKDLGYGKAMVVGSDQLISDHAWTYIRGANMMGMNLGILTTWMANADRAYDWRGYDGLRAGQAIGPCRTISLAGLTRGPYSEDVADNHRLDLGRGADITIAWPSGGFCSLKTEESLTDISRFSKSQMRRVMPTQDYLSLYHGEVEPDEILPLLVREMEVAA